MTDYAEQLTIPRPRIRIMDKLIDAINIFIPYIIAILIGAALGIGQGYWQCDRAWKDKIVTRATAELETGDAKAIHEEAPYAYYSRREKRP